VPEPTDAEYPFVLLTGRGTSAQWHTQTRTAKSDVLRQLYPENIYVEINPRDAERLRVASNQKVEIVSRRAAIVATAYLTATVAPGQVFLPMHYAATNRLTHPSFDPYSRQPSYKACAVNLRPLNNGRSLSSGVRPSSGAETDQGRRQSQLAGAPAQPDGSAPEGERTPPNTHNRHAKSSRS
jgi:predicted molibdopterin-dependent oxidoreductase YjgC